MREFDFRQRTVFIVDRNAFHSVESRVVAVYYLAEDSVLRIEMGLFGVGDKELRLVSIGTRICHCNDTTGVELREGMMRI